MTFLALGDSYTIGESVPEAERWPVQLAARLRAAGIPIADPVIVARTGWPPGMAVAGTDPAEVATIRKNFLVKKLGLADGPELDAAIETVLDQYGRSNRNKYRAVVYYLLARHFGKEAVYA